MLSHHSLLEKQKYSANIKNIEGDYGFCFQFFIIFIEYSVDLGIH